MVNCDICLQEYLDAFPVCPYCYTSAKPCEDMFKDEYDRKLSELNDKHGRIENELKDLKKNRADYLRKVNPHIYNVFASAKRGSSTKNYFFSNQTDAIHKTDGLSSAYWDFKITVLSSIEVSDEHMLNLGSDFGYTSW